MVQAALKLALVPIVNLSLDAKKETVKHHMIKFRELQDSLDYFTFMMEVTQLFRKFTR